MKTIQTALTPDIHNVFCKLSILNISAVGLKAFFYQNGFICSKCMQIQGINANCGSAL